MNSTGSYFDDQSVQSTATKDRRNVGGSPSTKCATNDSFVLLRVLISAWQFLGYLCVVAVAIGGLEVVLGEPKEIISSPLVISGQVFMIYCSVIAGLNAIFWLGLAEAGNVLLIIEERTRQKA